MRLGWAQRLGTTALIASLSVATLAITGPSMAIAEEIQLAQDEGPAQRPGFRRSGGKRRATWPESQPVEADTADDRKKEAAPARVPISAPDVIQPRPARRRVREQPQPAPDGSSGGAGQGASASQAPNYDFVGVPDRWRIVEAIGVNERWYDPYNQNTLKGDRPILGTKDWFLELALVSDTVVEPRYIPVPAGISVTNASTPLDIFGDGQQLIVEQNFIASVAIIKGDTAFRPPDWEFRATGVINLNYVSANEVGLLNADPLQGDTRFDWKGSLTELFVDKHLWNKSDRFDFDSLRVGILSFESDFRGFLFQDANLGARLFGNFAGNRLQYNLAYFRRIEKDANSGLPDLFELRRDDVITANLYYQDFPVLGFTQQFSLTYNRNREGEDPAPVLNVNQFRERPAPFGAAKPHNYDVVYLGLNGDGHFDRLNFMYSFYYAVGKDDFQPVAQAETDINAFFLAMESSLDFDWYRVKLFGLFSSGDAQPENDTATGFDAIFENPNFAGADTSYWVRNNIPLVFGGGVELTGRNAILPSLRTSKLQGQSSFVNPGLGLVGMGADFDILPQLRFVTNISWLTFHHTEPLQVLRQQKNIDNSIGWDISGALLYRPFFTENIVLRLSGAVLVPGQGLRDLYPDNKTFYSVLTNLVLTY